MILSESHIETINKRVEDYFSTSSVYIASNEFGLCKIGLSSNVEDRLKRLSYAAGVRCKLEYEVGSPSLGFYCIEKPAQEKLSKFRKVGEWFDCSLEEAIEAVNQARQEILEKYKQELIVIKEQEIIEGRKKLGAEKKVRRIIDNIESILSGSELELTDKDKKDIRRHVLLDLISTFDSVSGLAEYLGATSSTINGWLLRDQIGMHWAKRIEEDPKLGIKFPVKITRIGK